jgi:pilus assembly protein Flp/PilA
VPSSARIGPNDSSSRPIALPIEKETPIHRWSDQGRRRDKTRGAGKHVIVAAFLSVKNRSTRSEDGASLIEYALLLAFIAVVCVAAVTFFGGEVGDSFSRSGSRLP